MIRCFFCTFNFLMNTIRISVTLICGLLLFNSCTTDSFTLSFDEAFYTSTDTLRFDTVFTKAGSVTKTVRIFNRGNEPLRFESIQLGGGSSSPFQLNVNGIAGPSASAFSIPANDSIHIFVSVRIDPNNKENPFLVSDSIKLIHSQQIRSIHLSAYGQNAVYLKNERIKSNTTWTAALPYVIEGSLWIQEGALLTIEKGTRIHVNASAPIIADGTIRATGTKKDSISFQGDRLDRDYRNLPGSWPGIFFRNNSRNNLLEYVTIQNAYQGIVLSKKNGSDTQLTIDQSIIENCFETGLLANGSSVKMINTRISNCGTNIMITGGGEYDFNHCTIVAYSTPFIPHKKPVLVLTNWDSSGTINASTTKALFRNSVFWGENNLLQDEIMISKRGTALFDLQLENCLYKAKSTDNIGGTQNLINQPPLFDSVDEKGTYFDFHINKGRSPLINKGKPTGTITDLDGVLRDNQPDIGCYEKQ